MEMQNGKNFEELFYLEDENGEQMAFHFLDMIVHEGREYLVLLPAEGPYTDEAVILRRTRLPGGGEAYEGVEDLTTIRAVYALFRQRASDAFIYTDE